MTITNAFPNADKLEALQDLCPSGNTYKLALLAPGASYDKTATTFAGVGEVAAGGGYTAGGVVLTGYSAAMSGDVAQLTFASPSWSNSTISAGGAVIYDSTNGNKIRGVFSFGATITSTNGTFTATIPANAISIG